MTFKFDNLLMLHSYSVQVSIYLIIHSRSHCGPRKYYVFHPCEQEKILVEQMLMNVSSWLIVSKEEQSTKSKEKDVKETSTEKIHDR